jgi:hypothetical protein
VPLNEDDAIAFRESCTFAESTYFSLVCRPHRAVVSEDGLVVGAWYVGFRIVSAETDTSVFAAAAISGITAVATGTASNVRSAVTEKVRLSPNGNPERALDAADIVDDFDAPDRPALSSREPPTFVAVLDDGSVVILPRRLQELSGVRTTTFTLLGLYLLVSFTAAVAAAKQRRSREHGNHTTRGDSKLNVLFVLQQLCPLLAYAEQYRGDPTRLVLGATLTLSGLLFALAAMEAAVATANTKFTWVPPAQVVDSYAYVPASAFAIAFRVGCLRLTKGLTKLAEGRRAVPRGQRGWDRWLPHAARAVPHVAVVLAIIAMDIANAHALLLGVDSLVGYWRRVAATVVVHALLSESVVYHMRHRSTHRKSR